MSNLQLDAAFLMDTIGTIANMILAVATATADGYHAVCKYRARVCMWQKVLVQRQGQFLCWALSRLFILEEHSPCICERQ